MRRIILIKILKFIVWMEILIGSTYGIGNGIILKNQDLVTVKKEGNKTSIVFFEWDISIKRRDGAIPSEVARDILVNYAVKMLGKESAECDCTNNNDYFDTSIVENSQTINIGQEVVPEVQQTEEFQEVQEVQENQEIQQTIFPSYIENPYDFHGIKFDSPDTVTMTISSITGDINVSFSPVVYADGDKPSVCDPGLGKACTWADPNGNIYLGIHSGCIYTGNVYNPYYSLEAEPIREYLEGGDCNNTENRLDEEEIKSRIGGLIGRTVKFTQNGTETTLTLDHLELVKDKTKLTSIYPEIIMKEFEYNPEDRVIIPVTCGWDLSRNHDWFKANRWLLIASEITNNK